MGKRCWSSPTTTMTAFVLLAAGGGHKPDCLFVEARQVIDEERRQEKPD